MPNDLIKVFPFELDTVLERTIKPFFYFQGDTRTAVLEITVTENGEPLNLTGTDVRATFKKQDGTSVMQDKETGLTIKEPENGIVRIVLSSQVLAVAGRVRGQLSISSQSGVLVAETVEFSFITRESLANGGVLSNDDLPIIERTVRAAKIIDNLDLDLLEENITVINAMDERLTGEINKNNDKFKSVNQQLAQSAMLETQPDYVEFLKSHNQTEGKLLAKRVSPRHIDVAIPLANGKYQVHKLVKDNLDDFIKHGDIAIANGTSRVNYDSKTGTGWVESSNTHYTTNVGDTFTLDFNGTELWFYALHDDRGGIWEFVIDGGDPITISTHINASSENEGQLANEWVNTLFKKKVVDSLTRGDHTLVATFKGQDPNNPTPTPRGWVHTNATGSSTEWTFDVLNTAKPSQLSNELVVGGDHSNKEFAIGMRRKGATYGQEFVPDHGTPSAQPTEQILYFGTSRVDVAGTDDSFREVDSVKLVQVVNAINSNEPDLVLAKIYVIHTINHGGLHCKVKIIFETDTNCGGYVCMMPSRSWFAERFLVSTGESYEATLSDNSGTDIVNGDRAKSFAFINLTGNQNYQNTVFAMTIGDVNETFRRGKEGTRQGETLWIQHRSNGLQKLYPHIVQNYDADAGETIEADYTMYAGQVDYASTLLA